MAQLPVLGQAPGAVIAFSAVNLPVRTRLHSPGPARIAAVRGQSAMLHFVECAPVLPAGISPLMLSDQLLTLAQQADRAGFAGTAEQLLDLACAVLDAPPLSPSHTYVA